MPVRPECVKMSELARLSGVPSATIKHYLNEGLLPAPTRTSRNMAYYDTALVPRIQRIKALQRAHFLPLKVIREVLDADALPTGEETVAATIASVNARGTTDERRTRAQLVEQGMDATQLEWLGAVGLLDPTRVDGDEVYRGDDLELLRVLGAARRAGISAEMLPVTILGDYVRAIQKLASIEVELFRTGVAARANETDLPMLAEAAAVLSERLVVILRRKMLIPALRASAKKAISQPSADTARKAARRATTPGRRVRRKAGSKRG